MWYNVVSLLLIAIMLLFVGLNAFEFARLNRMEKIEFIKNFKKGKFVIIYVIAIPLFTMSNLYVGEGFMVSVFASITKSLELIVLKFSIGSQLFSDKPLYAIAMCLCSVLVLFNALALSFSLLTQTFISSLEFLKFKNKAGNKCFIIGYNNDSEKIYNTCDENKIVLGVFNKGDLETLFNKNICYKNFIDSKKQIRWIEKEFVKIALDTISQGRLVKVIVNEQDKNNSLELCVKFYKIISELKTEKQLQNFDVFIYGDRENEEIYSKFVHNSKGCLHYVNTLRLLAMDFIDKYPLTKYMTAEHIDYSTALVKNGVDINVSLVGFGKVNQQIFLSMVANNQFITMGDDGRVCAKLVNYHIFDLKGNCSTFIVNKYSRYKDYFYNNGKTLVDNDEYLELPSLPANETFHCVDLNTNDFYAQLQDAISKGKNSINYIVVSLGDDYKNIDVANRLTVTIKENNLTNTHIFIKIRNEEVISNCKILLDLNICKIFGSDLEVSYNYNNIVREEYMKMSIKRNFIYDIEKDAMQKEVASDAFKKSLFKWYTKFTELERESNLYCCLSIKNKLQMIGLDICEVQDARKGLSYEEFMNIYAKDDMPIIEESLGGTKYIKYGIDFKDSLRSNMAYQEHIRWNAFMISKGFIPSKKADIIGKKNSEGNYTNGKDYLLYHHGCLTTMAGLIEFRKLLAKRDGVSEEQTDVIKYDYQLLDGAWWLLNQSGFKIVKKD